MKSKLSLHQVSILQKVIEGATIFVDRTDISNITYTVTDDLGNDQSISAATFNKLEKDGLIKHKQSPHIDIEMWS